MRLEDKKGAVLIMTMMAIVLVFMMIHALMQTTGLGLRNSGSFYDREAALQAAQSGLDYAVSQLTADRWWRGDANNDDYRLGASGSYRATSFPQGDLKDGLRVSESFGNVVGLLKSRAGAISAFRIKFSYETTDGDTLTKVPYAHFAYKANNEPTTSLPIALPYVSLNNLNSASQALVYRAASNGQGLATLTDNLECGQVKDLKQRAFAHHLPPYRVLLIVEGLAGADLRDCTEPEEANKIANSAARTQPLTRRYVEAYYSRLAPVLKGNPAFAEQEININASGHALARSFDPLVLQNDDSSTSFTSGSLRSNDSITVSGDLHTFGGSLYCPKTATYTAKDDHINVIHEKVKVDPITYKQASQIAESLQTSDSYKMTPGYYEWNTVADGATTPHYELRYYGTGYSASNKPADGANYHVVQGSTVTSACGISGGKTQNEVSSAIKSPYLGSKNMGPTGKVAFATDSEGNITEPVLYLYGKLCCDGALTIASNTSTVTKCCPAVWLNGQYANKKYETGCLQTNNNVTILGTVKGVGSVVTTGDVTFCGESVFEAGGTGVAIYGNNVYLQPLTVALANAPDGSALTSNPTAPAFASNFRPDAKKNKQYLRT